MLKTASKLQLETLSLSLNLYSTTLDLLWLTSGRGKWESLWLIREIPVTDDFLLTVTFHDISTADYDCIESRLESSGQIDEGYIPIFVEEEYQIEMNEKYFERIRNAIMPNTLRKREPMTEAEKYIAARDCKE